MISCSRSILYFFSFFFYITIVITEDKYRENLWNLGHSFFLFYLEINNIIWCFQLKSVIFYKDVEDDVFRKSHVEKKEDLPLISEYSSFFIKQEPSEQPVEEQDGGKEGG